MSSLVMVFLAVIGQVVGESKPLFGGPCEYRDTPGVATIVSVEAGDPAELNCSNDPVRVVFDFQSSGSARAGLGATGIDLRISEGVNPPREWVENEGLLVGTQHACIRRDITSGECTPLLFVFPDADYEAAIALCYAARTFAMTVVPAAIDNGFLDQRFVLLVAVENYGPPPPAGRVHITAEAAAADITIQQEWIYPGQVCEVIVAPDTPKASSVMTASRRVVGRPPPPEGENLIVELTGERDGFLRTQDVCITIYPGEDGIGEYAATVRDRFIPYLAEQYPSLHITPQTEWWGTIVRPRIWEVSHYLFFSEHWEMGVKWHIMIPPYDWAEIYLRHRYTDLVPQYAFQISSLSADPPESPHPVPPPEHVDR